jgi:hypothetical protein
MKQRPAGRASSSEKIIRDIRRKTRKQYSAEEKIRIVLDGLRGEDSIAKPEPRIEARDLDAENQMTNFMVLASQASGYDLTSFFREWGFVLPQEDYDLLAALKLPEPEIDLITLRE